MAAGDTYFPMPIGGSATSGVPAVDSEYAAAVVGAAQSPLTVALLGDSFFYRTYNLERPYQVMDYSDFAWFNAFLGNPFRLILNAGVVGETTAQILARVPTVIAARPAWCFLNGGTNDGTSVPFETVAANIQLAISQLVAAGIRVVYLGVAPNAATLARSTQLQNVNRAVREYCYRTGGGCIYVDTYAPVVDPTSTTGAFATGMSADGTHITAKGARARGLAIATTIRPFLPASIATLPSSAAESWQIDNTSKQVVQNPMMTGTGGTTPAGTCASNWTLGAETGSATITGTAGVTRTDGIGSSQRMAISAASSGALINIRQTNFQTRVAIGDTIYGVGSIKLSGMSDVTFVRPSVEAVIDGTGYSISTLYASSTTYDNSDFEINFMTPAFLLSGSAISNLSYYVRVGFGTSGTGAATLELGRAGIYKY